MKIRPVGAKIFHADRETDTTKLIVDFRSFANAPKKTAHGAIRDLAYGAIRDLAYKL